MIPQALIFYMFSAILILSALGVIVARNPIYSALLLIMAFLNATGLLVILGAEFLAMALAIVYVGAIAVLFLFVVMLLNIRDVRGKIGWKHYILGIGTGLLLLCEIAILIGRQTTEVARQAVHAIGSESNTKGLGLLLYTDYSYIFIGIGLLLLVGMVGVIALALPEVEKNVKRQKMHEQTKRTMNDTMVKATVAKNKGVQTPS